MARIYLVLAALLLATSLASCGGGKDEGKNPEELSDVLKDDMGLDGAPQGEVSEEVVDLVLEIPTPQDAAEQLKKAGAEYQEKLLLSPDKINANRTQIEQARALGVYSTDLAYSSAFDKKDKAVRYFSGLMDVAKEIGLGTVFDKDMQSRVMNNKDNNKELDKIFNEAFSNMITTFQENHKEDLLSMVIASAWVESAHLAVEHWKINPNDEIVKNITEYRGTLPNVLKILDAKKNAPVYSDIYIDLAKIQEVFSQSEGMLTEDQLNQTQSLLSGLRGKMTN